MLCPSADAVDFHGREDIILVQRSGDVSAESAGGEYKSRVSIYPFLVVFICGLESHRNLQNTFLINTTMKCCTTFSV